MKRFDEIYKTFTIAEIAAAYDLTFANVRYNLTEPPTRLCEGTIEELRLTRYGDGTPLATLAKEYNTTLIEIQTVLYNPRIDSAVEYSEEALTHYWVSHDHTNITTLACLFRKSSKFIEDQLIEIGLLDRAMSRKEQILAMTEDGHSPTEIAEHLRCPPSLVYSHLSKNRLFKRKHKRLTEEQWNRIKSEFANGVTVTTLAQRYDVSRAAIYRQVK